MFLKTCALSLLVVICMGAVNAQASDSGHGMSINVLGALAQGDFRNNIRNGGGIDLGYAFTFGDISPISFSLGANGMFTMYGHESYEERFSYSVSRVRVNVETNNTIAIFGLTSRLTLREGVVRPYIEGRTGLSYLFTYSSISDQHSSETIASSKNFSDTTFSTAFGGGFLIPVYPARVMRGMNDDTVVNIDCKFLYWHGGNAEYLPKGGIYEDTDTGGLVYDVRESRTDMTSLHLGVVVEF